MEQELDIGMLHLENVSINKKCMRVFIFNYSVYDSHLFLDIITLHMTTI